MPDPVQVSRFAKRFDDASKAIFNRFDGLRIAGEFEQSRRVTACQTGLNISSCAAGMIHADIVLKQTGENVLTGGAIVTVRIVAARLAPVLLRCKMGIGWNFLT